MKCPYCGQEMIDQKEFCVNCGKKLIKEKKSINAKGVIILFAALIIVGFITCYLVINYNTKGELDPYINEDINEKDY